MSSPYRSPKTFKLKPYQSKTRGRERVRTGALLLAFAFFNLYLTSVDGLISLFFAIFFWVERHTKHRLGTTVK